jgi:ATP-dependent Clp protease ATP-binding subunit ClpC
MNWNNLTEKAQKVILIAQEEAHTLGNDYLGTEHLLLGLIKVEEGIAYKAILNMGVDPNELVVRIEDFIRENRNYAEKNAEEVILTPRAKRVLELAEKEAINLGDNYISTEHILLAIVHEGGGVGVKILQDMGVDLQKFEETVYSMIGEKVSKEVSEHREFRETKTPTLDQFSRDLTYLASRGELDPVIGRESEIERVIEILMRRKKNNPAIIGDPGVGKTAVVEGLAQKIADNDVPDLLKGKRVVSLDLASVIAGTKYRGEFEERMKKILKEVTKTNKNIILFIDEFHTLVGAGAAEGAIDASNILKPSLSSGEIQVICATTLKEYRKYVEKDPALERRFQPVYIKEPTVEEAIAILKGIRERYEKFHGVRITDEAIELAVKLSVKYISDRFLPDKAIDVMDESGSRVHLSNIDVPKEITELEKKIAEVRKDKTNVVKQQDFERAAHLRDTEKRYQNELDKLEADWENSMTRKSSPVTENDVSDVIAMMTGIPMNKIAQNEQERLLSLEEALKKQVVGQDEAIEVLSKSIRRARSGLKDPRRPIGSFMFLGPTGVGKTELAKALARVMFDSEDALIRIDMSEYMEKFSVSRLIGAPPGYVGYEEGGQLTEAVRRKPYCVLLLDEIEKAHQDVFNILLQVLDEGRLTDSKGKTVNFKNTIIIMTSNLGSSIIQEQLQFINEENKTEIMGELRLRLFELLKSTIRPEFLNRIDEILLFKPLTQEDIRKIVDIQLNFLIQRLEKNQFTVIVDDDVKEWLGRTGFDIQYGARPLKRVIQKYITNPLSEKILDATFIPGDTIHISLDNNGRIEFIK